jgi:hypothetical protein
MHATSFILRLLLGFVLCTAIIAPAFSGGDDYDAMNDTEGEGPVYFGFVRDSRGSPVSNALVMLNAKGRDPVVIKTNVLGLFRSHISKDVQPDDVQLSCEKQGYKQTEVLRRAPPGSKAMNIEINCTLRRM